MFMEDFRESLLPFQRYISEIPFVIEQRSTEALNMAFLVS